MPTRLLRLVFALLAAAPLASRIGAQGSVATAVANTAIVPAPFQPQRHDEFVAIAKKGDIDCLRPALIAAAAARETNG